VAGFDEDDLIVGASNMKIYNVDFNDGVNAAIMGRLGVAEVYSNDRKHLGEVDFLRLIFE
jgi:predicted nucleic acid-binding protein